MAAALLALLALALLAARDHGERLRLLGYAMICAVFQFCGACLLLAVFGWTRLWQMLRFTSAGMQNSESVNPKLAESLGLFVIHPAFGTLCVAAAALGIWLLLAGRDQHRAIWPSLVVLAIVLASYATGPALWFPPHDIVVLLALVGLFTLRSRTGADDQPVIRVIYATSLVGGLITAATSDNGIHNFPIGGLAAAALAPAILVPRGAPWNAVAAQCGMLVLTAAVFCASAFASIYGENVNPLTARAIRVKDGAFAGLLTNADQAAFIAAATAALGELAGRGKTIAVMGRPAGIYLLTDASPMALSAWDYWQFHGSLQPRMNALMEAFYRLPAHRPDVVAVFTDPRTYPLAPWARELLTDYVAAKQVSVGSWSLSLFEPCRDSCVSRAGNARCAMSFRRSGDQSPYASRRAPDHKPGSATLGHNFATRAIHCACMLVATVPAKGVRHVRICDCQTSQFVRRCRCPGWSRGDGDARPRASLVARRMLRCRYWHNRPTRRRGAADLRSAACLLSTAGGVRSAAAPVDTTALGGWLLGAGPLGLTVSVPRHVG